MDHFISNIKIHKQMSKSLFKITFQQRLLMNEIESMEGELTPEMETSLQITESELQQKSIAYLEVIRKKEAFNTLVDNEIKRLQQMKKVSNNVIDRLNDNLLTAVKTFGTYEVGLQKFGTRKSSKLIVENINGLPEEFKTVKVTESADKVKLKAAIKEGKEIEGVYIEENLNLKIN